MVPSLLGGGEKVRGGGGGMGGIIYLWNNFRVFAVCVFLQVFACCPCI